MTSPLSRFAQLCIIWFTYKTLAEQISLYTSDSLYRPLSAPWTHARTDSPVRWCLTCSEPVEPIYGLICVAQLDLGNADQRPQRIIHRLFVGEIFGNIRGKEYQVRSLLEPLRILASHTTFEFGEVVSRPQIVGHFSIIRLLHNISVSADILPRYFPIRIIL